MVMYRILPVNSRISDSHHTQMVTTYYKVEIYALHTISVQKCQLVTTLISTHVSSRSY